MAKKIMCAFGTDIDSVAGWIGSYGGGDSPSDIQRGIFASEVGIPRLLRLFDRYGLKTSFFIPGHSLETFPKEMEMIVKDGHEVGAHGYLHENPIAMTPTQEEDVLVKSIELIKGLTGQAPRGYVAPWWEMSNSTAALLLKHGFTYDHSQGYRDFQPFYARVGDSWNTIDYSKTAKEWMHPLKHGKEIDLVDIAANWYVDDLPPMMFMKKAPMAAPRMVISSNGNAVRITLMLPPWKMYTPKMQAIETRKPMMTNMFQTFERITPAPPSAPPPQGGASSGPAKPVPSRPGSQLHRDRHTPGNSSN